MSGRADQKVADPERPSESIEPPLRLSMSKVRGVTLVTLESSVSAAMRLVGTRNPDFAFGLLHQIANASSKGESPDELGIDFMLGFLQSRAPKDEIESMVVSQMAATHVAIMRYAHRLSEAESIEERDSAERAYNKLIRTFVGLLEVYDRRWAATREALVAPVLVSGGAQTIIEKETSSSKKPPLRLAGSQTSPDENDARRPERAPIRREKR
jgi:hypothetical protein